MIFLMKGAITQGLAPKTTPRAGLRLLIRKNNYYLSSSAK